MALPRLASIGEVIKMYGLSAKQQLSQNFLLDLNITDRMVRAAGDVSQSYCIEVGSGPGSLTRSALLLGAKKVIAVEKDGRFLPALNALQKAVPTRLSIAYGDALLLDEAKLLDGAPKAAWNEPANTKILGNLPFAVSTTLLLKWIRQIEHRQGAFEYGRTPFVLTFQAEVADRIIAQPGTKEYGRLSVMVQQSCLAKNCFTIFGKSFVPPPEVDARVVYIEPLFEPVAKVHSLKSLEYVLRETFSMRRKQISNSIMRLGKGAEELLQEAKVNPHRRPEEVTVEEWCAIANAFDRWPQKKYSNFFDYDPPKGVPENYTEQALLQVYQPLRQAQIDREERKKEAEALKEERAQARHILSAKSLRLPQISEAIKSDETSAGTSTEPVGVIHLEEEEQLPAGLLNYSEMNRLVNEQRLATFAKKESHQQKTTASQDETDEDEDEDEDDDEADKIDKTEVTDLDQVSVEQMLRYLPSDKVVNRLFSPTVIIPVRQPDGTVTLPPGVAPAQLESMFGNLSRKRQLAREQAAKQRRMQLQKQMLPDPASRNHVSSSGETETTETVTATEKVQPAKSKASSRSPVLDLKRLSSLPSPSRLLSAQQKAQKKLEQKQKEEAASAFQRVSTQGGIKNAPATPYPQKNVPYSKRFPGRSKKDKRQEQILMSRI